MFMVASVTIKDGIFPNVLKAPLMNPSKSPNNNIRRIPIGRGTPMFFTRYANETQTNATVEPGERSMPPVRMTRVPPIATIATNDTWSETLLIFVGWRNRGVIKAITTTTTNKAKIGPAIVD
jgi:hypothetical protein